jgi:hypothetical protein
VRDAGLAGRLVEWVACWLVGWLVGWLFDWLVSWLDGWLVGVGGVFEFKERDSIFINQIRKILIKKRKTA